MQALRISVPSLLALLAAALLSQAKVQAEIASYEDYYDVHFASYTNRLADLEAELASLRALGPEPHDSCGSAGCLECDASDCCDWPTWNIHFEASYLRVHEAGILIPAGPITTPQLGQDWGYRVFGGLELWDGIGSRVRYFDFNDSSSAPIPGGNEGSALDIYAVDLEFTHRAGFCGWNTLWAGGVRIAGIDQSLHLNNGVDAIDLTRDFDGAGLTFAVEFERTCWWLSLYGGFRGSLLYNDVDLALNSAGPNVPIAAAVVAEIPDQTISVWEIQIGFQYEREFSLGNVIARVGGEAQLYEQPPLVLGLLDNNVGLFGPTFSIGIER